MQAEHSRASLCEGEKEVDIDILITSMNGDRKIYNSFLCFFDEFLSV